MFCCVKALCQQAVNGVAMKKWVIPQENGVSILRLLVMRIVYAITGILFGVQTWQTLIVERGNFEPFEGVAFAYWGALSILMLIGLRFPLKMLPLLLLQFLYKVTWLIFVGWPLQQAGLLDENAKSLFDAMQMGTIIDLIAIPWIFAAKHYLGGLFQRQNKQV